MLRSGLSNTLAVAALLPLTGLGQGLVREGGAWVRTLRGTCPVAARLRVNASGPVTLEGGVSGDLTYTLKVAVRARTEAEARRILDRDWVRVAREGEWAVMTVPGGPAGAILALRAPRLSEVELFSADGSVTANGIDGTLHVDSRGGSLSADRIRGACRLFTAGGEIRVGRVDGALRCVSGAGRITVDSAGGEAILETNGGDIGITEAGGAVTAQTAAGSVHIGKAGGPVVAVTGGGQILVDQAGGLVTARNMAGPVRVGTAAGVLCESGNGGVHLSSVSGTMRVSTAWGSIFANLLGGRPSDSFLTTGNGDITVTIPSNLGVTIRAENNMADTIRRIISDFPAIPVRRQGNRVVAEGPVNGGGPLLRISDTGGTIYIKRQP